MKIRVILSPDAKADIRSAIEWYHQADPNLASRFEKATFATLRQIRQFPYRFQIINGAIRQALLKRFPYAIYYSLRSNKLTVTAVLHQRRSDTIWRTRRTGHN
jgi:plasmid stabilization system protein ParE